MKNKKLQAGLTLLGCVLAAVLCAGIALYLLFGRGAQQAPTVLDTVFENGRAGVPVTVVVPARGDDWPLVVLCHGFTGNRGGDGHFAPLQRQLAEAGIASVAPDFAGCGASTEDATAYTLTNLQADITACVAAMAAAYPVDTTRLGLVGHSMGGRLVSLYLTQGDYPVKAAALWSPANGKGAAGLEFLDIDDPGHVQSVLDEAKADGSAAAGRFDFTLSRDFVVEMENSDPNAALAASDAALLLCYTGHEALFSAETVEETTAAVQARGGEVVTAPFADAGHNYTAWGDEANAEVNAELEQALCEATAAFLAGAM